MERKTVKIPSGEISFLHRNGRRPVVFIHGLGGAGNSWLKLNRLLDHDFDLYFPDIPGHGRSYRVLKDYTVLSQAEAVRDFITALDLEDVTVVGNSYGGWIVLRMTVSLLQPDHLILIDSAGINPTAGEVDDQLRAKFIDKVMRMASNNDRSVIEGISRNNSRPEEKITIHELGKIKSRTAIIWGRNDSIIPVKYASSFHDNIKGSSLFILDGVGHLPHIEDPEALSKIINEFL